MRSCSRPPRRQSSTGRSPSHATNARVLRDVGRQPTNFFLPHPDPQSVENFIWELEGCLRMLADGCDPSVRASGARKKMQASPDARVRMFLNMFDGFCAEDRPTHLPKIKRLLFHAFRLVIAEPAAVVRRYTNLRKYFPEFWKDLGFSTERECLRYLRLARIRVLHTDY